MATEKLPEPQLSKNASEAFSAEATKQGDRDARWVRNYLGLGPDTPLPRCNCRSDHKRRQLRAIGDHTHDKANHVCLDCQCGNVAGMGTEHLGWGPCRQHEKTLTKLTIEKMCKRHHDALLSKNPGVYRDVGRFAKLIQREASESAERMSLIEEIQIGRGLVQELIAYAQNEEDGPRLTEYIQGDEVSMSDKTRLTLIGNLLPKINKLASTERDFRQDSSISKDHFRVWYGRLWSELNNIALEIGEGKLATRKDTELAFKDMLRRLGDPRHGIR